MKRRWLPLVMLILALVGCSAPAGSPDTDAPLPGAQTEDLLPDDEPTIESPLPGEGQWWIDRNRLIPDVVGRINEIAPTAPERGLSWHAERIAVLFPHYVLVWYTEGHSARLTLFRVTPTEEGFLYQVILDGEPDLYTPVDWDWRTNG